MVNNNKKDSLIIYFGIFILIIVIILFFVLDQDDDDPNDKFTYEDSTSFSKFREKTRNKSNFRKVQPHPVLDYQKKASNGNIPASLGDPIRPFIKRAAAGAPSNNNSSLENMKHSDNFNFSHQQNHPVLEYQRNSSFGTSPSTWGDPIRLLYPGASPSPSNFRDINGEYQYNTTNIKGNSYGYDLESGPYPGDYMGVPVKRENMKSTSEYHKAPFYNEMNRNNRGNYDYNNEITARGNNNNNNLPFNHQQRNPLHSYDYFKPYGPNQSSMQSEINYADTPFYNHSHRGGGIPFISSVDSFAPFPEVQANWEKSGMIQTVDSSNTEIMNIYRKPIAPLRDLFEYSVQDKNGFVVPLKETYLEDGDIIHSVPGREALGKWRYNDYVRHKYVWQ
jgi:hypothetical protein